MKLKRKTIFSITFLFIILYVTAIFVSANETHPIGKRSQDGTWIQIHYFDVFAQTAGPNGSYQYNGAEVPLVEETVVEFQQLLVYFILPDLYPRNISFTLFYSFERVNQSSGEIYYVPIDNETRNIETAGNEYLIVDEFNLPIHTTEVHVRLTYKEIEFVFYHHTSEAVLSGTYTGYEMKWQVIKNIMLVFCIVVIIGGVGAYFLTAKAGVFDLHYSWAIMIPLLVADIFLLYTEYIYYISLKETFYLFPIWAIYFLMTVVTMIILVNVFNHIRGKKFIRCSIYNTKGIVVEAHDIPLDQSEKKYQAPGFKASCIRLFSPKRDENSFQIGKFTPFTEESIVTVKKNDKIDKVIEKNKKMGLIYKRKEEDNDGNINLIFLKTTQVFEETEVVPRWFWAPKGGPILKEFWCKQIKRTRDSVRLMHLSWLPAGLIAIFNLLFNFFAQNKSETLDAALKVSLWILFGIVFMATVSLNSVTGVYQIEVLDPHIAMSIVKSQQELNRAEKDAEIIVQLKNQNIKLTNDKKIDTLDEAKAIATDFIRSFRSMVAWNKDKSGEELHE